MEKIFFVLFIVFGIIALINPLFSGDKINKYIKKQQGKIISTKSNIFKHRNINSINKAIDFKYYDKNENIRIVTLHYLGLFTYFGEDKIIEYSTDSQEYKELKQREITKQLDNDKKARSFEGKNYSINDNDELTIKQEYTNPNIGEYVYVNNKAALDGKYKLGFMNYIYVNDGKVETIKMN